MARNLSPYLSQAEPKERTRGDRAYDPRQIYHYIFDNTDRYGVVLYTQKELADAIQVRRQTMTFMFAQFIELGFMEKVHRRQFRLLKKPDEIEWNDELYKRFSELRKRHQTYYRNQTVTEKENENG